MLQVPLTHLRKATSTLSQPALSGSTPHQPLSAPSQQPAQVAVGPTPQPPRSGAKVQALTVEDGSIVSGTILRVEKTHVVVQSGAEEVVDVPRKSLDEKSRKLATDWQARNASKPPVPDPRVKPGAAITLEFPDLEPSFQSSPPKIEIRIPQNYKPGSLVPIALFLQGGEGGSDPGPLADFVGTSEYVLVAFPYCKNLPMIGLGPKEGKVREMIAFQKPMLERLQALLPNTDPKRRVVIGTSNGAHTIGIAVCDGWDDFADYFSAFVLHEGGSSLSKNFKKLKRKNVLVVIGGNSESRASSESRVDKMLQLNVRPDVEIATNEGHGMGDESRRIIREWVAKLSPSPKTLGD